MSLATHLSCARVDVMESQSRAGDGAWVESDAVVSDFQTNAGFDKLKAYPSALCLRVTDSIADTFAGDLQHMESLVSG